MPRTAEQRAAAHRCGRPTKVCRACGHHLRCHGRPECVDYKGPRPPCRDKKGPAACATFGARPCESRTLMRNGACRAHGGKALSGPMHPAARANGYKQYLPARLQAVLDAVEGGPDKLSLQDEIGLLRAWLRSDIEALQDGRGYAVDEVEHAAASIATAYRNLMRAHRSGAVEAMAHALSALDGAVPQLMAALEPGQAIEAARRKMLQTVPVIERSLRAENDRLVDLHGLVALDVALADRHALVSALVLSVDRHVTDPEARKAIRRAAAAEYARLTDRRDAPALAPAGGAVIDIDPHPAPAD